MLYLNVCRIGDEIFERYLDDDGKEHITNTTYAPVHYYHSNYDNTGYRDIYGKSVEPKHFETITEAREWLQKMRDLDTEALGMDNYELSYISDRYSGSLSYNKRLMRICNFDIEVTAPMMPKAENAVYPIDAITHYDSIDDRFYVFDLLDPAQPWDINKFTMSDDVSQEEFERVKARIVHLEFNTERELLMEYVRLIHEKPPAILTGWHIEGFDIPYLCERLVILFGRKFLSKLSPFGKCRSKVIKDSWGNDILGWKIEGISTICYMEAMKKFLPWEKYPSYTLDYIAKQVAGIGKREYDGHISKLRGSNHQLYIDYNIQDVYAVQMIDYKRKLIDLVLDISYHSKINFSDTFSPIKTWDAIIYNSLRENNIVVPEKRVKPKESYAGAFVLEPKAGFYKYVMSFDLTSLYPSIIRQVGISPETIRAPFDQLYDIDEYVNKTAPRPSDIYSCSPSGWMYDKSIQGVIPTEITKVFNQRKEKKKYQQAAERNKEAILKILASRGVSA